MTSIDRQQHRVAVVYSCFEQPDTWSYRQDLDTFTRSRFPQTQSALELWRNHWQCSIDYFACSSFGMLGNSSIPNTVCEVGSPFHVLKSPDAWHPFGLTVHIYWLLSGKQDNSLIDY